MNSLITPEIEEIYARYCDAVVADPLTTPEFRAAYHAHRSAQMQVPTQRKPGLRLATVDGVEVQP